MLSTGLSRRIALLTTIGFTMIMLLSVAVMTAVLRSGSDERRDEVRRGMAPPVAAMFADLRLPAGSAAPGGGTVATPGRAPPFSSFAVIDADGAILLRGPTPTASTSAPPIRPVMSCCWATGSPSATRRSAKACSPSSARSCR